MATATPAAMPTKPTRIAIAGRSYQGSNATPTAATAAALPTMTATHSIPAATIPMSMPAPPTTFASYRLRHEQGGSWCWDHARGLLAWASPPRPGMGRQTPPCQAAAQRARNRSTCGRTIPLTATTRLATSATLTANNCYNDVSNRKCKLP